MDRGHDRGRRHRRRRLPPLRRPAIAREIGFKRRDGGFQTEVGFGDLALGVVAVLTIWFRDRFLLAVVIVTAISLWGDAYGHIHQAAVNDNHDPDNTGPVLYADILFPLVAAMLYAIRERLRGHEPAVGPTAGPSQAQR